MKRYSLNHQNPVLRSKSEDDRAKHVQHHPRRKRNIYVDKLNTNLDPVIGPIISKENYNVSFNDLLNELKNYERNSEMHEYVMFMKEKNINSLSKKLRNSR
jgi:hypothetical protein